MHVHIRNNKKGIRFITYTCIIKIIYDDNKIYLKSSVQICMFNRVYNTTMINTIKTNMIKQLEI